VDRVSEHAKRRLVLMPQRVERMHEQVRDRTANLLPDIGREESRAIMGEPSR
jgi:hypothetical protein